MKSFSWRYKSWIGIEGSWDSSSRVGTVKIVALGLLLGVDIGVAVKAPAG